MRFCLFALICTGFCSELGPCKQSCAVTPKDCPNCTTECLAQEGKWLDLEITCPSDSPNSATSILYKIKKCTRLAKKTISQTHCYGSTPPGRQICNDGNPLPMNCRNCRRYAKGKCKPVTLIKSVIEVETAIPYTDELADTSSSAYIAASSGVVDLFQSDMEDLANAQGLKLDGIAVAFSGPSGSRKRRSGLASCSVETTFMTNGEAPADFADSVSGAAEQSISSSSGAFISPDATPVVSTVVTEPATVTDAPTVAPTDATTDAPTEGSGADTADSAEVSL